MPDATIVSNIDGGVIDDANIAAIEKAMKQREGKSAPSTQEQLGAFVDWKTVRDALGQPFDVERVPVKKLRQQRRDSMLAFGLHYRKTPLVRAKWHMEARDKTGPNAQITAFMDAAWRKIHARYVFQHTTDFDFGFAAIVKRFEEANPGGYYVDNTETDPEKQLKPAWDEGTILPISWKPFIGLPPERVTPKFNNDGEFDGIVYEKNPATMGGRSGGLSGGTKGSSANDKELNIDVYHALWATNDKDSVFGSIFGYPLIAHAYRYWWSYWYLWTNIDRAFERMAVPPILAFHPEGSYVDIEDGSETPYYQIAQEVAMSLRSNAVAAVPSTLATAGLDERGSNMREWEFRYMETPNANFEVMHRHLNYLDVMKLRSLWVPEQAFIEGEGGSSSRNVASQMGEIFMESQANKWEEIADHINRYILPQLLAVNFPEFVKNGGTCKIVGHGFSTEDTEFMKQIVQLVGQADATKMPIDMRTALERIGIPLLSPAEVGASQKAEIDAAAAASPPAVSNGTVQTVPNTGFTNGGSQPNVTDTSTSVTGFSDEPQMVYMNPQESIALADHDDFLTSLPPTGHYADKQMRAYAVQLRAVWLTALKEMYSDFGSSLKPSSLKLSDFELGQVNDAINDDAEMVPFTDAGDRRERIAKTKAQKLAKRALSQWGTSSKKLAALRKRSAGIIEKMIQRSAKLDTKRRGTKANAPTKEEYGEYIEEQTERLVKSVLKTTKDNIESKLVNDISVGKTVEEIQESLGEHFDTFPEFRADRIARSETRDAYNMGVLIAAQQDGLKYVRAKDAQHGPTDEYCEARDGQVYTIAQARKELKKTHANDTFEIEAETVELADDLPYSTLEFESVSLAEFSIEPVKLLPAEAGDAGAWYDKKTGTAYVPMDLSDDDTREFLGDVIDYVNSDVVMV